MKKRRHIRTFTLYPILLLLAACTAAPAPTGGGDAAAVTSAPAWISEPPAEEGYFFGVGCDSDAAKARRKAIVNIGQQYSTHVSSALRTSISSEGGSARAVLEAVNRQLTDQRVVGAKIYDQFIDSGGTCWALSRAPLDCALDVAESVVLSYILELKEEAPEYAVLVEELERSFEEAVGSYVVYPREAVSPVPPLMIEVDGRVDDWGSVQPLIADPIGDGSGPVSGTDIAAIYLAHDGGSLFLRYDLADGNPGTRGLFYGVGLRDTRGSWERMLFTAYDGGWSTGIDEWTGEPGRHARVSAGTVRQRDGSIEAEYDLAALKIPPGAELEVNAWLDPSGRAYDTTIPRRAILDPEQSYFIYRGTIHGKRVDGASLNPSVRISDHSDHSTASRIYYIQATFSLGDGTEEWIELRFAPDMLETGTRNRLSDAENSGDEYIISSSIIEKVRGYRGNLASGTIYLLSYDGHRAVGKFELVSNDDRSRLQGLFNVSAP